MVALLYLSGMWWHRVPREFPSEAAAPWVGPKAPYLSQGFDVLDLKSAELSPATARGSPPRLPWPRRTIQFDPRNSLNGNPLMPMASYHS